MSTNAIVLKDEQGKVMGIAISMEEAQVQAWRIRGKFYTNPLITFCNEQGEKIGQYPPAPDARGECHKTGSSTAGSLDEM